MKTYIPGDGSSYEGEMTPVDKRGSFDCGQWVHADVAQGLYDALNALVMSWDGDGVMILEAVGVARDALAAADREDE